MAMAASCAELCWFPASSAVLFSLSGDITEIQKHRRRVRKVPDSKWARDPVQGPTISLETWNAVWTNFAEEYFPQKVQVRVNMYTGRNK